MVASSPPATLGLVRPDCDRQAVPILPAGGQRNVRRGGARRFDTARSMSSMVRVRAARIAPISQGDRLGLVVRSDASDPDEVGLAATRDQFDPENGLGEKILAGLLHPAGLLSCLRDQGVSADKLRSRRRGAGGGAIPGADLDPRCRRRRFGARCQFRTSARAALSRIGAACG